MTRRPKSRLPPKLPDPTRDHIPAPPRGPTLREQLKDARVAGRSVEFGHDEITTIMRRVARNDEHSRLGCPVFGGVTIDQVASAVRGVYGWTGDGPRARIAPQRTIDAFDAACARILEVARDGGRLAFATGRPASLFALHRVLAAAAEAEGGAVFDAVESAPLHAGARSSRIGSPRLRWLDRVAVITDGRALLTDDELRGSAADELLYTAGRPDLVVADRTFAGVAIAAGLEVVAFAGLDALALAVAAWRGLAVRVVPLDEHRPPQAYLPLTALLEGPRAPV